MQEREVRRVYCGSTYWLRPHRMFGWMVEAGGVVLCSPRAYAQALAVLDAVAPIA